jgi:Gram-negative bacterial TonB protein C-terminal
VKEASQDAGVMKTKHLLMIAGVLLPALTVAQQLDQQAPQRVQRPGVISGHPLLVEAALKAVEQWKYQPYLVNGEPLQVETTITIKFRM